MLRWLLTVLAIIFALLFWYMALTVPMVQATAPAIIAVALSVVAFFAWPKHRKTA